MISFHSLATVVQLDAYELDTEIALGTQKQLGHFGGYTRRAARNSLKYRSRTSKPGETPTVHYRKNSAPSILREFILYALQKTPKGTFGRVLIGPTLANKPSTIGGVPRALEIGGRITVIETVQKISTRKASPAQSITFRRKLREGAIVLPPAQKTKRQYEMGARPYMVPAFRRSLGRFTTSLAGSVGR